ncbi:MAG TPA: AAA family ATPase [Spirochaetia bacterium]|nr:AAA family ATPase [Spirochaetales bacterium]HRY80885.1 AAA family ATPase [Spirochaetia bacterium]
MTLPEIATLLKQSDAKIILVFGFNAVGKTQLSVAYKNETKLTDGTHTGVYYNAYSEDLFVWNNDEENNGADTRLIVQPSTLSKFHSSLTEGIIRKKLKAYKPKYDFEFTMHDDVEKGIKSISFFIPNSDLDVATPSIKISRGEERIFVWCFFLALFEVEGWADINSSHLFIDDPVSSLDDHNIFITSSTLFDLIDEYYEKRKIIIATHHIGLFSILFDYLQKGEKSDKYKRYTCPMILSSKHGDLTLETCKKDVFLYHLRLLQILKQAQDMDEVKSYHFVLLRQVLENMASFLGTGKVGHVLQVIGVEDSDTYSQTVNTLSHKNIYLYESDELVEDNKRLFSDILGKLMDQFKFVLHAE